MSIKPNLSNASSEINAELDRLNRPAIPREGLVDRLLLARRKHPGQDGLRLILETALDAVIVMKSDGIVTDWNDRAVSAFGWSRNEAVGRTLADLIVPERHRDAHRNGLRRYLASKQGEVVGKRLELSGLKKNGEEFPVELSISRIEDGESILFVGCLRDLTERDALRAARDELARTARIVATSEIAASFAHEIDQPLSAIVVNAGTGLRWLERPIPNLDEVRASLKRIVNDGRHASEVIAGIRSMFTRDVQERPLQDLNELILAVLTIVRGEVEAQRVSIRTELFDVLPQVRANQAQLRQVVVNLITNAVDAMSTVVDRPRILRIKTEIHQFDYLLVEVEDSGIGIDQQNIHRIFDPFFTTKSHGMGMGLPICRSIVESHGGRLSVFAGQFYGSTFRIFLPICAIEPER
jgi:PAS domain S-box-containing protein